MELSITPLASLPGASTSASTDAGMENMGGSFAALLAGQITGLEALFPGATPLIDPALMALLPDNGKASSTAGNLLRNDEKEVTNILASLPQLASESLIPKADAANDASIGSGTGNRGSSGELLALLTHARAPRAETSAGAAALANTRALTDETPLSTQTGAAAHTARPSEHTPAPAQNTPSITAPLHDNKWSQQLSDRVLWLARGDMQSAQINITPAHLGPIQINLSLNGEQMSAQFVSAHQEVRQALEDALPRLREMLAGAGINLGQANVGSQQQQQTQAEQFTARGDSSRQGGDGAILPADQQGTDMTHARPVQRGQGLVDLFA